MKSFKLNRRAMLFGAGAGIALPMLDAMLDNRGLLHGTAHAQSHASPQRLLTFFFPGGCDLANWHPMATGTGYVATDSLMPLMGHRGDITVISGLNLNANVGEGDGHGKGIGWFATAAPLTLTASTGTSVDWAAQEELGGTHKVLNIGLENKPSGVFGGVTNTGDIYGEISWSQAHGGVVQAQRSPQALFTELFGSGPVDNPAAVRARHYEQSILDYVSTSTMRLQSRLGAADRARLDAHLTSIRDLEGQIMATSTVCMSGSAPGTATGTTNNNFSVAKARQMMDLVAIAFACDISRYGSYMLGNGSSNNGPANHVMPMSELDEHSAAHDGSMPVSRYDQIRLFKRYQMTQLNYFLDKLASYSEAGGTVLDNTAMFVNSELADPVSHSHENMPILVCGKAGGRIVSAGSHLHFTNGNIGDLLFTLLKAVGSTRTSFGNSHGTVPGILAG